MIGLYVGLIVSVFALCAFCAAPVLGSLSDHYGRRPILVLSLLGSAAGDLVFGLGGALWVLFAGRIILSAPYWAACAVVLAGLAVLSMSARSLWPA